MTINACHAECLVIEKELRDGYNSHCIDGAFLFTNRVILYDMADEDDARVTFRDEKQKIEYLDKLIAINVAYGRLDGRASRSDLLRQCIDRLIVELEAETDPDLIEEFILSSYTESEVVH